MKPYKYFENFHLYFLNIKFCVIEFFIKVEVEVHKKVSNRNSSDSINLLSNKEWT